MLILTRKMNESFCLGSNVEITVLSIKGNQVRFGITAPKEISIDRSEIRTRKLSEASFNPGEVK
jgi:carbon storage regulator